MLSINEKMARILHHVKRPGDFHASGTADFTLPGIEVEGIGLLALPLLPVQAEQLIRVASQAPYGKGEETVVDTQVRKTWQIEADKVQIRGKHWQDMLDNIVAQVVAGLGVSGEVHAELYKMLVYDEGSFFINHRDTEKAPGMFATLIIALPSVHTGGELRIEHAGQEVLLPLQAETFSEVAFAAFYADCVHEVLPVTSGCRWVLAYNVCRREQGELPQPPDYQQEQQQAAVVLHDWATQTHTGEDIPLKLVYLLEHAYTPEGLSFHALKNGDAAIGAVLSRAAAQAACDLYLALVSVEESGSAEYNGWGQRRRGYWNDDDDDAQSTADFEIIEVTEENQYIAYWHAPDGSCPNFGELPFEDDELCLPQRLQSLKPDEEHFHEATGNEGASFERTYRRAALVMWPHAYYAEALAVGGLDMTLPYLADLSGGWQATGTDQQSPEWQDASGFAQAIINSWPEANYSPWRQDGSKRLGELLETLVILQDAPRIEAAIRQIAIGGKAYQQEDNPAVLRALLQLPDSLATWLLIELIGVRAARSLPACAQLLRMALSAQTGEGLSDLLPAAQIVLAHVQQPAPATHYSPIKVFTAAQVVDILVATGRVDSGLGQQAVDQMLLQPSCYPMDGTLIQAVLLAADASDCPSGIAPYLRAACLQYLETCLAKPLSPPADWTREVNFKCQANDAHCENFARFLRDPTASSWDLRAAQGYRSALESIARNATSDVSMVTIKQGSPHTLRFTKNQASYDRRVKQRKLDERYHQQLKALN